MFGIGMNEFLLLVLLALVVIGPKRLPEVARGIGKLMVQFKRATRDLREAVSDEVNAHPELKELQQIRSEINADLGDMQHRARSYVEDEFKKEQDIAGAVERDVQGIADRAPIALAISVGLRPSFFLAVVSCLGVIKTIISCQGPCHDRGHAPIIDSQ